MEKQKSKFYVLQYNIVKYIKENRVITKFNIIILTVFVISVAVMIVAGASEIFANFVSNTISYFFRFLLSRITYFIPFSLAEFMLFSSFPLAVVYIIYVCIKFSKAKGTSAKIVITLKNIVKILSAVCIIYSVFVFTLGILYLKTPLEKNVGIERRKLSAEDLYKASQVLVDELNKIDLTSYKTDNIKNTSMPYNLNKMSAELNKSFDKISDSKQYTFFDNIDMRVKPVIMSVQMSKMHITGVYSFFTGESNVNVDFPDYSIPFTAAHEMAHIRGVAREDEANFTAFLICINSDDSYIKYSGIINMLEYFSTPLYNANKDYYTEIYKQYSSDVLLEFEGYREFFEKYRETEIAKIANNVNNSYLKSQGQEEGLKATEWLLTLPLYIC